MAHLILSRRAGRESRSTPETVACGRVNPIIKPDTVKWIIRYTFYAFVFSLPFEEQTQTRSIVPAKVLGIALRHLRCSNGACATSFLRKHSGGLRLYLSIVLLGFLPDFVLPRTCRISRVRLSWQLFKLVQLLVLFWISYNLLKQEQVVNGTLWALAAATMLLAILQFLGINKH